MSPCYSKILLNNTFNKKVRTEGTLSKQSNLFIIYCYMQNIKLKIEKRERERERALIKLLLYSWLFTVYNIRLLNIWID